MIMENKELIELNIQSKLIYDYLRNNHDLLSSNAWNSKNDVIRFSTVNIQSIFKPRDDRSGYWHNGNKIFYEIINGLDSLTVRCSIDYKSITSTEANILLDLDGKFHSYYEDELCIIEKWVIKVNDLIEDLNAFIKNDLSKFERMVSSCVGKQSEADDEILTEGEAIRIATLKYERNPIARQKCLDYYGYHCRICGFDFEKKYGKGFKKIIEVHHIKPLCEIKENYIVDPINDLIPVCSNCHTVLHSKKDGVYTPEDIATYIN